MSMISIIIPVYNTKRKDIESCVESILQQSYGKYELLLIDDGSNRTCAQNLDEIAAGDERFTVYHNTRRGVSAARNYGVKKAKGKYITFVDSDDVINPYMLEEAVQIIKETDADFIIGSVRSVRESQKIFWKPEKNLRYRYISAEQKCRLQAHNLDLSIREYKDIDGGKITRGPCARFVRTQLALHCHFYEHICIGEDLLWNSAVLDTAAKIVVADRCWYYYIQHPSSITHKYDVNLDEHLGGK